MVVLTMCGCAVLWCVGGCVVLRGVGVVCCTTCVRDCVCWLLLCVVPLCVHVVGVCVGHVCMLFCVFVYVCVCLLVCLCVVGVVGWYVGVWVRLRCDGLGLAAVAWTRVCMCVSWLWCLFVRGCGVCLCSLWCGVCCDAVWTMLLAAAACVDARVLCGLTAATDWRLGCGWPAWWRGHWMYSW